MNSSAIDSKLEEERLAELREHRIILRETLEWILETDDVETIKRLVREALAATEGDEAGMKDDPEGEARQAFAKLITLIVAKDMPQATKDAAIDTVMSLQSRLGVIP